jgi:uncharacterized protein (TIGR02598 family)
MKTIKPTPNQPNPSDRAGFSLVEVVIAMGIVATVLTALLALLPYGMENVREAKNTIVMSRIANEILSEVQQADWGTNGTLLSVRYHQKERLFDSEGDRILPSDGRANDVIYKALIEVPDDVLGLPGQSRSSASPTQSYRRQVSVKIAFAPGSTTVDYLSKRNPLPYKMFGSVVVRMTQGF